MTVADHPDPDEREGHIVSAGTRAETAPARKGLTVGDLVRAAALDRPIAGLDFRGIAAAQLNLSKQTRGSTLTGADLSKLALVGPRLTLSEALVGAWRERLQEGQPRIPGLVATDMSRSIAAISMAGFAGLAGIDAAKTRAALFGGLTGEIRAMMTKFGTDLMAGVRPLALLAARSVSEALLAADEREREAAQALLEMEWWMPHSAMSDFVVHVHRLALAGDRTAVRHAMTESSHSLSFARQVKHGWMRHPVFAERRRFLLDGLADHQRGRYRVSIPTLLPHLEGIAMAAFAPGTKTTKMRSVVTEAAGAYDLLLGDALVQAATRLWTPHDFDQVRPSGRRLNRHLILHGRSTGYGTEENSTKLLFTFDLLASLVEQAERAKRA